MRIEVPHEAKPAGSKKAFNRPGSRFPVVVDDCKESRSWKTEVGQYAKDAWGDAPLLLGPVRLVVVFIRERPKRHYGTGRNAGIVKANAETWHISKPDATKLLRAVEDALTGIVWKDDSQVVMQCVEKRYGDKHLTIISVDELGEATR